MKLEDSIHEYLNNGSKHPSISTILNGTHLSDVTVHDIYAGHDDGGSTPWIYGDITFKINEKNVRIEDLIISYIGYSKSATNFLEKVFLFKIKKQFGEEILKTLQDEIQEKIYETEPDNCYDD